MMQNFGSHPKSNCKTTTEVVIIIDFLYLIIGFFILGEKVNSNFHLVSNKDFVNLTIEVFVLERHNFLLQGNPFVL